MTPEEAGGLAGKFIWPLIMLFIFYEIGRWVQSKTDKKTHASLTKKKEKIN